PLGEDFFYLVCRVDHPLARSAQIGVAALRGERMIHLGKGSSIRQSLAGQLDLASMPTALEVDHLATVRGLILAGLGLSLVPGMTLFHFRHPDLAIIPLAENSRIRRQLYLDRKSTRLNSSH